MHNQTTPRSLNRTFDILRHPYRRRLLVLLESQSPLAIGELSATSLGVDADPEILQRSLYHSHLPRLADAGFIDWYSREDTIRQGPRFDDAMPILTVIDDQMNVPVSVE